MRKLLTSVLIALAVVLPLHAVETIIVGEIVNETTGEAIPNVNIHFRGTKIGTTSDANGNYALRVDMQAKSQLVFSAVGYFTQRFDIEPGTMAGLQVALREKTATLTEVVVSPSENPALEILRQVRARRLENDRTLHPENVSTLLRDQTLYVSHISKKHLRRALWRSLQSGMVAQEDSTYIMPLYRETQSFRFAGTESTPANDLRTQSLILTSTDYSSLLGGEGNLNFYASSVSLMGHAFLSPLAPSGNLYYRYYLTESEANGPTGEAGHEVTIVFRTRNPFYATFNGSMVVDTATFALRSIQAYVPPEVAVNYVNNIHLTQNLLPDGTIADEHISVLLDFAVKSDQAGTVFPTLLINSTLTNLSSSSSSTSSTSSSSSPSPTSPAAPSPDSAFAALDSLPVIRVAKFFATVATTGYIPTGTPVDIGHVEEILQVNQHEGVHFGLPFRTNERFSKVVSLEASVGYGIRDRAPKGMGRISVNLPTRYRNYMQLEYNDRYVWSEVDDFDRLLRENSMGWGNFDFTAYAFEALKRDSLCVNTALRQRQIQYHWFADWGSFASSIAPATALESHAYIRAGWQDSYAYQSLSLITRLSWGERKYDGFFSRRYAYSGKYPVLYLGAEFGHWASLNNQQSTINNPQGGLYAHLRVLLTHHANLGMGGTLTYAFRAGAIFGSVPPTLLWQANANQGYAYDPYRFTFLHGTQLMADKYATLQAEWNGHGILFNLIPGIRWLHLRELVEAKIAYGYLSENHQSSITNYPSSHSLYGEVGIGIGNILRVCDLYSVWGFTPRLSTLHTASADRSRLCRDKNSQLSTIHWGIRFRIHLGL